MNPDLLELQRSLSNIHAEITILKNNYELMKENHAKLELDVHESNKEIIDIRMEINGKFNTIDGDINSIKKDIVTMNKDVQKLTGDVHIIDQKLDRLSSNNLLSFFAELDFKKSFTLILILASLLSSPTLLGKLLNPEPQADKLDQLIELLQPNPNTPPIGVR